MSDFQDQLEQIFASMKAAKETPRKMGRLPAGHADEKHQKNKKALKKRKKR